MKNAQNIMDKVEFVRVFSCFVDFDLSWHLHGTELNRYATELAYGKLDFDQKPHKAHGEEEEKIG